MNHTSLSGNLKDDSGFGSCQENETRLPVCEGNSVNGTGSTGGPLLRIFSLSCPYCPFLSFPALLSNAEKNAKEMILKKSPK